MPLLPAGVVAEKDAPLSLDDHEDHMRMFWHMLDDKIAAIVPSTSKPVLVGAVHLALDQGNEVRLPCKCKQRTSS